MNARLNFNKGLFSVLLISAAVFLLSCGNGLNSSSSAISIQLPYGISSARNAPVSRAADGDSVSYEYEIIFTHENGTATSLSGKSGSTVTLRPAEPGKYQISGSAYDAVGELCYSGSCTAEVPQGKTIDVELTMSAVSSSGSDEDSGNGEDSEEIASEADHIKVEPSSGGVKITLKWHEEDGDWIQWYKVVETGSSIMFDFYPSDYAENYNKMPSAANPTSEFTYPFTSSGETYVFKFCYLKGGTEYTEEEVSCTAGGGIGKLFDSEKWAVVSPEIDNKNFEFKISGDLDSLVSSSNRSKFSDLWLQIQLWGGNETFEDAEYVNAISVSFNDENAWLKPSQLAEYKSISIIDRYAKYFLGNMTQYDTYFIQVLMNMIVDGTKMQFTTEGKTKQVNWYGERITFVQGNEPVTEKWSVNYCCDENKVSTLSALSDDKFGDDKAAFKLTSDFDNDEFELAMQFEPGDTVSLTEGSEYTLSFKISRSDAASAAISGDDVTFDFRAAVCQDSDGAVYTIANMTDSLSISASSAALLTEFSVDFTAMFSDASTIIRLYPYQAGEYVITDLAVTAK